MSDYNLILDTDSYKQTHYLQYPPNTKKVFSYVESRGGVFDETVMFGLHYYIKKYLLTPFTSEDIEEADDIVSSHFRSNTIFNRKMWEYILKEYGGYLPIEIQSVPEGCIIPTRHFLASVVNTDDNCYSLTSHSEVGLLRACWYGTTVATLSYNIKKLIKQFLEETANPEAMESLPFRLHDFGARGVSSYESSCIGGMAHLVNFKGTDTLSAIREIRRHYQDHMAGFSVPAAEHSSITSWGRDGEYLAYRNMIEKFGGRNQVVSIVPDSYDILNAIEYIFGEQLHSLIVKSGTHMVFRPDSGKPSEIVLKVVQLLGEKFGFTVNSKGYKVLPPHIRVLQGDGVNYDSINEILTVLKSNNWSTENVLFGMGGALLQQLDRDTFKFAMKCSAALIGDTWVDVFKDPITDPGKQSKKGILTLAQNNTTKEFFTTRVGYV
ncbi:MAG: nicotinate phosphoribosyltransferase, partial [Nitrososphaeraceae archaeon]